MIPATATATISDLIPGLTLALQNRSDIGKYSPEIYIKKAIEELTLSYPFEELRVVGPQVPLIPTQAKPYEYPVSYFLNQGDDYTQTQGLCVFITPNVAYPLKYDTPTAIQTILFIPGGLPSKWTRFGKVIWIGTQPSLPYTSFMLYQRRHPFTETNLIESPVYMPPEWLEIVEYTAAYRMAAGPLRWTDMAQSLRNLVYGDPNDPSEPGLIKRRFYQQQLDQRLHSRRINVVTGRSS